MRALHTAATGMMAQGECQVISPTISPTCGPPALKRQRPEFQDLLYEQVTRVGTQTSARGQYSSGRHRGWGLASRPSARPG